ncbi:MAG: redoxin domain-containing protein, partial [Planctomycetaceae bacterium]|nr:redoxin domain-containing protein [Planctomycetaceae bacterium]
MRQVVTGLIVLCWLNCSPVLHAEEVSRLKTVMTGIVKEPFDGTAAEYKAFFQKQGNALVSAADKLLTVPDLTGLYRVFMEKAYTAESLPLHTITDPKERAAAFLRHLERFMPYIVKYCAEEDDRQLIIQLAQIADRFDPDGSFGLIEAMVRKLGETVEKQSHSKTIRFQSRLRERYKRLQLPGNEMEYKAVTADGNRIDLKDYRGKVVFLSWDYLRNDKAITLYKKLYDALHDYGLEMIVQDVGLTSREGLRKQAEDKKIPWIVACRGRAESNLPDYYEEMGMSKTVFLIGRDGKVIQSWSNGFTSAVCESLKKLFPEQADILAELAAGLEQKAREEQEQLRERLKEERNPDLLTEELRRMLGVLQGFRQWISSDRKMDWKVLPPETVPQSILRLTDILSTIPGQENASAAGKARAMRELADLRLKEHPELKPDVVYAELESFLEESIKTNAKITPSAYLYEKFGILHAMSRALDESPDKLADAKEIQTRFTALAEKFVPDADNYIRMTFTQFLLFFANTLEEIGEPGAKERASAFFLETAAILEQSKDYELQAHGKTLRNRARRLGMIGKELELECVLLNGETVNIKDFRGKIVLVNFWATWCGPCLREFPNMKTQYEKYRDKGYEMIA